MRIPGSWNDRGLLDDEPFLSHFFSRALTEPHRQGKPRGSLQIANKELIKQLKKVPSGLDAARAWLEIVFAANAKESPKLRRAKASISTTMLGIFVEAFWLLHQGQDVLVFLNRWRKSRGYRYGLDLRGVTAHVDDPFRIKPIRGTLNRVEGAPHAFVHHAEKGARKPQTSHPQACSMLQAPPTLPLVGFTSLECAVLPRITPSPAVEPSSLGQSDEDQASALLSTGDRGPALTLSSVSGEKSRDEIPDENKGGLALLVTSDDPEPPMPSIDHTRQIKPALQMRPPIWAQSRQEICESFDWFRSYQSGVYYANNIVKGYLLSAFASSRDLFHHDGKLIISHGGGKSESLHSRQGRTETHLADDQRAQDKSVRALLTNYKDRRPLVLLIDDKYALFPYNLAATGITYAVLGFYIIAHAWAEYQSAPNERGRVVRYKFAFQWCESQGDPWWIPRETDKTLLDDLPSSLAVNANNLATAPPSRRIPVKLAHLNSLDLRPSKPPGVYSACIDCKEDAPRVYREGWLCLNPECLLFWSPRNGQSLPELLNYDADFLRLMPASPFPVSGQDLKPSPPAAVPRSGITTSHAFSRGWHCVVCGRLSCRFKWEHWECPTCGSIFKIPGKIRAPNEFWNLALPDNFLDHSITKGSGIVQSFTIMYDRPGGHGHYQSYTFPHQRGRIYHIQAGQGGNKDADNIFKEYQEQAADGRLAFRRWPLRTHKLRGALLTNYFSQNAGEPYQYVGGAENTVPFDAVSSAVVKARQLIQERVIQALGRKESFNELLSCAYMDKQKMAFHSDSEKGLGPVVAGLSLGSPAMMHFRPHAKYEPKKEHRRIVLSFILRHGDILVMDGNAVQQYYEHAVVPFNFRIAATARWIEPLHS